MKLNFDNLNINDKQLEIMLRIKTSYKDLITHINLHRNNFTKIPKEIKNFKVLKVLMLSYCKNLKIFNSIVNIKNLSLNGCTSLELIKDLTEVDMLNLQDCSSLASIDSI